MVLCAVGDGTVKILEPPADAVPGAVVSFPGFGEIPREPLPASQIAKKKILEGILPDLKTDGAGVAMYKDSPFMLGEQRVVSELKNVHVS